MATETVNSQQFSDGATVGAYDATFYPTFPPNGIPPGSVVDEAVAQDNAVTFTGLSPGTAYFAATFVSGVWRHVRFVASEPVDPETVLEIAEAALPRKSFPIISVVDYGAKGDGSDCTAAVEAAAAVWDEVKGVLYFPVGVWNFQAELNIDDPAKSIVGDGKGATVLRPPGTFTGTLIRWHTLVEGVPGSDHPAGNLEGMQIDGSDAGEGAIAVDYGDVVGATFKDFVVRGFVKPNQKGIQARNVKLWTEETTWSNVTLENNKVSLEFSKATGANNSFGYHTVLSMRINAFAGQTGLRLKDDVHIYSAGTRLTGNLHGAGCIGIDLMDTTRLTGLFNVALETNEAGTKPLRMSAECLLAGTGYFNTGEGGGISENAGVGNMQLAGEGIHIPGIETFALVDEHTFMQPGEITVTSLEGLRHFVYALPGQTIKLIGARFRLGSGGPVTFKIQKSGVDVAGFTGLEAKVEPLSAEPTPVALTKNDALSVVVTGVAGTPKILSITLFVAKAR